MTFGVLITNGGTHDPEGWAHFALQELVPVPPGATSDVVDRVIMARQCLRPSVVAALQAVRDGHRQSLSALNPSEYATLKEVIHRHHGKPTSAGEELGEMHLWTGGKVREVDGWLDKCVRRIVATACASNEDKACGHNQMLDHVYNVMAMYVRSVQMVESSHHVTEQHPVLANWR